MTYKLMDYDKRYEKDVIQLWQDVCVEEFGFEIWRDAMSNVEEDKYEKLILAIVDDKVVATMAYKNIGEKVGEIKRVYMYAEYRGKGISQAMLNEMIEDAKEKEYKKLIVETWTQFARGVGFYEKNNFQLKEIDGECIRYEKDLVNE